MRPLLGWTFRGACVAFQAGAGLAGAAALACDLLATAAAWAVDRVEKERAQ